MVPGHEIQEKRPPLFRPGAAAAALWTALAVATLSRGAFGVETIRDHTLAILCSGDARATGIGDRAAAALSGVDGVRLVERERLDVIAREFEVSMFSENGRPSDRVRLGQLAGADELVLLSLFGTVKDRWLKMVVTDCRTGTRLRTETFEFGKTQAFEVPGRIRDAVVEIQKAYPLGVTKVVGVAPFVSRNLTHDYDSLQSRFAHLLQLSLTASPGVAAIETEEALALRNEQGLASPEGVERVVPVLVDGEFLVDARSKPDAPQITFTVRISRSTSPAESVQRGPIPLADAGAFLSGELLQRIFGEGPGGATPVSQERQFGWLTERADKLSQLGFWTDATGLREAALMMRPDDVTQRLKQIDDYERITRSRMPDIWAMNPVDFDDPPSLRAAQLRADAYATRLSHLEYLIRNRSIPVDRAVRLADHALRDRPATAGCLDTANGRYRVFGEEQLAVAEVAKEQFILQVMPVLWAWIEANPGDKSMLMDEWRIAVVYAAVMRLDHAYWKKEDLGFIRQVLTQVLPDLTPLETEMGCLLSSHGYRDKINAPAEPVATDEDWLNLLGELDRSGSKMCRLYARDARIVSVYVSRGSKTQDELQQLEAKMDSLLADHAAMPYLDSARESHTQEQMYLWLRDARDDVDRQLTRMEAPTPAAPAAQQAPASNDGQGRAPQAAARSDGRNGSPKPARLLQWADTESADHENAITPAQQAAPANNDLGGARFEDLDLKIRRRNGQIIPANGVRYHDRGGWWGLTNVVACGANLDVWWQAGAILFMRDKGFLDEVFVDDTAYFGDVRWDGKMVWIATRNAGVWVVKPDGTIATRFNSESGLPPADEGIVVLPLSGGRAIAVGSFGQLQRAWCALLDCNGPGGGSVDVFHEARRVARREDAEADLEQSTALCFSPCWLHNYEAKDGSRSILVGRDGAGRNRPLQIDPVTLEVGVFGRQLKTSADLYSKDCHFSRAGFLLGAADDRGVLLYPPPGDRFDDGTEVKVLCRGRIAEPELVLAFGGQIYAPGASWQRIDPQTWKPKPLDPVRKPMQEIPQRRLFGVSAHYGLVAWANNAFYRITGVAPEQTDAPEAGLSALPRDQTK